MKIVILRSVRPDVEETPEGDYLQEFDTRYAERVIGNLRGNTDFCTACGPDCSFCREPYKRTFGRDIAAVIDFPGVLPYVLEHPAEYVPRNVPPHDVLLIINIHEQVLLEILMKCRSWGTRGVVVPLEAPGWVCGATKAQAFKICGAENVEISFPKPFCSFNPPRGGVLAEFRSHFHIGFPDVELTVKDGRIAKAHVNVSAACGATYYIARWLVGRRLDEDIKIDVISRRMHSYPCTASMEWDNEIADTPLHIAGKAHYEILSSVKQRARAESQTVISPLGTAVQKPVPVYENLRKIENAKEYILNELQDHSLVTLDDLRKAKKITPAAMNSALLILKKEGKILVEGAKIFTAEIIENEKDI